jgi:2-polyprenyl-3-methyl-5-hydroxy-6-metoxy-1,4-benzoquinol methylase
MEKIEKCPICEMEVLEPFLNVTDYFLTKEQFTIVNCKNCGFRFTNPRPQQSKLSDYYKSVEYISHSNNKKGITNKIYHLIRNHNHKKKFSLIKKYSNNGKSILDIGCATGEFLNFFKQRGWKTTGVEPGVEAGKFAKEQYNLDVYDEREIINFADKSYDVITMWHVLEHVPSLNERMKEISRLINENGILVIAVPNSNSYDAKYYKNFWAAYDVPRHLYHFTKETLLLLIEKHGFMLEKISPMKFDSYYVSLLSEKYKNGKPNFLNALYTGFISNYKARKSSNNSSIIFVCKKSIKTI